MLVVEETMREMAAAMNLLMVDRERAAMTLPIVVGRERAVSISTVLS